MGGYLGSVGNGFQNQENLTNEAGVGGASSIAIYTLGSPMHQSQWYSGTFPTGAFSDRQQGAMVIPTWQSVSDANPSTYNEWEDTLWRNGISFDNTNQSGPGFIVDAASAGSSVDIKFIARDTTEIRECLVWNLGTFDKVDDETGSLDIYYHASISLARIDLQTYLGGGGTITYPVSGVTIGTKTFTFTAATQVNWSVDSQFEITGSNANDGTYTVASSSWLAGTLTIVVDEVIPDATVDGDGIRTGGVLSKNENLDMGMLGRTIICKYDLSIDKYYGHGLFQDGLDTNVVDRAARANPWTVNTNCNAEVIPTSLQPNGTLQYRWAGPSAVNSVVLIYKHHTTGEIYKKTIARTSSEEGSERSGNLGGGWSPDSDLQILTFQANVGEDLVDALFKIEFTSPATIS